MKGIFFGYVLTAGCEFTDKYLVAPFSDFDHVSLREDSAVADPKVQPLHVNGLFGLKKTRL